MGKAAENADAAHDDGGAEECVLAVGILQNVAVGIQTAKHTQQRIQRQRADGRADTAAQISCHIDSAAVSVPVGGQTAHGVVGDGCEGIEKLEHEVNCNADAELQGIGNIKASEHQHRADSPGNCAPQGEGTTHFTVLEPVIHSPVTNQGIVNGIPQDAHGSDDAGMGDFQTHDVGQEEQVEQVLEVKDHVAGCGEGAEAQFLRKTDGCSFCMFFDSHDFLLSFRFVLSTSISHLCAPDNQKSPEISGFRDRCFVNTVKFRRRWYGLPLQYAP